MKIYQLIASGRDQLFGSAKSHHSRRVFCSKEEAELHKPDFLKACCHSTDEVRRLHDLEESSVEITIKELDLQECYWLTCFPE